MGILGKNRSKQHAERGATLMRKLILILGIAGCCGGKIPIIQPSDSMTEFQLPFPGDKISKIPNQKQQSWRRVPTTPAMIELIRKDKRSRRGTPNKDCQTNGEGYAVFVKYPERDPIWGGNGAIFLFGASGKITEVQPLVQPNR